MRSLRPSKAADMLANIVSPPIAGTSLATRIVAFGGFPERLVGMPDVGAERRIGFIVAKFDQHRGVLVPGRGGCGQFAEPAAEVHQVVRAVLVAEDDQLVLDQRVLDGVAHFVGNWLAKIDAGDLSAEVVCRPA